MDLLLGADFSALTSRRWLVVAGCGGLDNPKPSSQYQRFSLTQGGKIRKSGQNSRHICRDPTFTAANGHSQRLPLGLSNGFETLSKSACDDNVWIEQDVDQC